MASGGNIVTNLILRASMQGNMSAAMRNASEAMRALGTQSAEARSRIAELQRQFNAGAISANQFATQQGLAQSQIARIAQAQSELTQASARYTQATTNASKAWGEFGGAAAKVALAAAPLAGMVKVAMDFEAGMSKVAALSGATESELKALTAEAERLGATTKFSATQSAEAMQYLALAGMKTNEIIGAMPGLLGLAAASGEDLAMCADIVSDQLTAFGKGADYAGYMANTLAAVASAANTNVFQAGEALKYAGSVAGTAGYEFDDVAVAMGVMANAATKGSMAGTALRSIITRLVDPPKDAAIALASLEGGFQKLDANGKLIGIMDQLDQLREKTKNMSEAKLLSFAKDVAGAEAMTGFASMLKSDQQAWDDLKATIKAANEGDVGAAEKMAAIMQNNTVGAVEQLSAAWEALSITIGKEVLPILTPLIKDLTELISKTVAFGKENPEIVKTGLAFASVGASAFLAVKGFTAITSSLTAVREGFALLRATRMAETIAGLSPSGGLFTGLINAAGSVVSSMGTLGNMAMTRFVAAFSPISSRVAAVMSAMSGRVMGIMSAFGGRITSLIAPLVTSIATRLAPLIAMFSGPLTAALGGIVASFGGLAAAALPIIGIIAAIVAVGALLYANWDTICQVASVMKDRVMDFYNAAVERLQPAFEQISSAVDRLKGVFGGLGSESSILEGVINTLGIAIGAVFMGAITVVETFIVGFAGFLETASIGISEFVSMITNIINGEWAAAWENMGNIVSVVIEGIIGTVGNMVSTVVNGIRTIAGAGGGGTPHPIAANAEGGIYKQGAFLTTFAEDSPEAAIPLDGSQRAISLWQTAGEMLGQLPGEKTLGERVRSLTENNSTINNSQSNTTNSSSQNISINIPVTVNGEAGGGTIENIQTKIEEAVRKALENIQNHERRVSFA